MASVPKLHENSGLPFSTLPEAVPVPVPYVVIHPLQPEKKVTAFQSSTDVPDMTPARSCPRWSGLSSVSKFLIVIVVILVVAIGTVVGVLVHKDKSYVLPTPLKCFNILINCSSNSSLKPAVVPKPASSTSTTLSSPSTPTPPSVCRGTVCPSMLAVVADSTPSAPGGSTIFLALGQDNLIWYRRGDGITWFSDWINLGAGGITGGFQSQPAAVTFSSNQTNVWVVDTNSHMRSVALKNGLWDNIWIDLGGTFTTPMTSCSYESGVLDVFGRANDGSLVHMNWNESGNEYSDWLSLGGYLSSAPMVTCAGNNRMDVVLYGGFSVPFDLFIRRWDGSQWLSWQGEGGSFKGDPFALSIGSDRTDYFGIGVDQAMYHMTWTASTGYGFLENIGGLFESVPYAIAIGTTRIDVLAVGLDDQLKHKAFINSIWSPNWDDLGGSFNSAPTAVYTTSGKVSVFGIGHNGSVFHGTWTIGSGATWTDGNNWTTDGGSMSTTWFRDAIS
jgi:hypothetical protein